MRPTPHNQIGQKAVICPAAFLRSRRVLEIQGGNVAEVIEMRGALKAGELRQMNAYRGTSLPQISLCGQQSENLKVSS